MGSSRNTLTARRAARPLPVASRSLLAGIFTVRRSDLTDSPGESNEDRDTDTDEVVARVCLIDLVLMLASGSAVSSCVPRDRRDRRSDMVPNVIGGLVGVQKSEKRMRDRVIDKCVAVAT